MKRIKSLLSVILLTATTLCAQEYNLPIAEGKFTADNESLKQYECPEWFRDAKFGIWAHWGPQAVPELGDWYARTMYINDPTDPKDPRKNNTSIKFQKHVEKYGHPSEFGYKDIIPLWTAEKWNPEKLMKLYKRVGAKYFVSMGVHHDNYYLWETKYSRWNSVNVGPHRDVVGEWQAAAKKEGLYFGVSEHLAQSFTWFQTAHRADKTGEYAGIPYDGANPKYQDLYHEKAAEDDNSHLTNNPKWHQQWYDRIKEVVDVYKPDLLYSDSRIPFGVVGRSLMAHYYNSNIDKDGNVSVVYNNKDHDHQGRFTLDVERGGLADISKEPWQTDTSIGSWYYSKNDYMTMTSEEVVKMLVDIVSKNGNLLLNVVQTPDGELSSWMYEVLEGIANWMEVNSEAIYGTRPWSVYGEGPSMSIEPEKGKYSGIKDVRPYLDGDLRFTKKDNTLYVFNMMPIKDDVKIESIGAQKVKSVKILGSKEKVKWNQKDGLLTIKKPKVSLSAKHWFLQLS